MTVRESSASEVPIVDPLGLSRLLLAQMDVRMSVYNQERIPQTRAVVVVSNHRSFLDPCVLMNALGRPLRTACHHYMGRVPVMNAIVHQLGCFILASRKRRGESFLVRGSQFLQAGEWVAVFPEGARPMVKLTQPHEVSAFQRGFAHLLLQVEVPEIAVLPVAIASREESISQAVPLRWLRLFDPSEALFDHPGWHPMVVYRHLDVLIGRPYWIGASKQEAMRGKSSKGAVLGISRYCQKEIASLLSQNLNGSHCELRSS